MRSSTCPPMREKRWTSHAISYTRLVYPELWSRSTDGIHATITARYRHLAKANTQKQAHDLLLFDKIIRHRTVKAAMTAASMVRWCRNARCGGATLSLCVRGKSYILRQNVFSLPLYRRQVLLDCYNPSICISLHSPLLRLWPHWLSQLQPTLNVMSFMSAGRLLRTGSSARPSIQMSSCP